MKILSVLFGLLLFWNGTMPEANPLPSPKQATSSIEGTWQIDLRPTPDAAPYYKDFIITKVRENTFEGEFYHSPIQDALINDVWDGSIYIAFKTQDQNHSYYHYAHIKGEEIEGMTYCKGRQLVMPWRGVKKE